MFNWERSQAFQGALQFATAAYCGSARPLSGGDCSEVYRLDLEPSAGPTKPVSPLTPRKGKGQHPQAGAAALCVKVLHQQGAAPSGITMSPGQLLAEALSLAAMARQLVPLASTKTGRTAPFVPQALCWRQDASYQVLLLPFLTGQGEQQHNYRGEEGLAEILFQLHHAAGKMQTEALGLAGLGLEPQQAALLLTRQQQLDSGQYLGFICHNFIGRTPQQNYGRSEGDPKYQVANTTESESFYLAEQWPEFFAELRLQPLFEACARKGRLARTEKVAGEALCAKLPDFLPRLPKASLLHGDLWSGNVHWCGDKGDLPFLIDPACYYGHCEVDLAMMRLFSGFSPRFYQAYRTLCAAESGWRERVEIYNLYHLLNHLLMFGGSYLGGVQQVLRKFS